MLTTLTSLWPIFTFFGLGYAIRQTGKVPSWLPHKLNMWVVNAIFPVLILLSVPRLEINLDALFAVAAPWLCILLSVLIVLLLSRLINLSSDIRLALLILTALGNTGFLGVPMVKILFGGNQVGYAVMFDQLGTFIGLSSYATILVAVYSAQGKVKATAVVKQIVLFPPFITLMVALALPADALLPIEPLLALVAKLIIPLTMLSIGMQFKFRIAPQYTLPLVIGLSTKMLLAPLLIWLLAASLVIDIEVMQASVFQAATPTMVTAAALLMSRNIASEFTAAMLGFGTLLAMLWLPLLALMLGG